MVRKKCSGLSENELEVMKIIWESPQSHTIQEITDKMNEDGTEITTAAVIKRMKNLKKKHFVEIDGEKLVTTVYARTYKAAVSKEEYIQNELNHLECLLSQNRTAGVLGLVEMLFQDKEEWEQQEIQTLELQLQKSIRKLRE